MISTISRILLRLWGYSVEGDLSFNDKGRKTVVAVVPHTHWKDFPLGLLVRSGHHLNIKYIAKKSLFKPAYAWLFKALGGYPVDRKGNTNFVSSVIEEFKNKDSFCICVTPEGTRKKVNRLRSGYYWIAKGAGADIVMTIFDVENKKVIFKDPYTPTDDHRYDMKLLENMVCGYKGFVPEFSFDCR